MPDNPDEFVGEPLTGASIRALPRPTSREAFEGIPSGTKYIAPDNTTRQKPWQPRSAEDFDSIPEGDAFYDPEGTLRQKPLYHPIGVGAQTLYDMVATDKERRNVLTKFYGEESVKSDHRGELYVETPGGRLKPGRGVLGPVAGFAASAAAPTAGAVGGGIVGAAAGPLTSIAGAAEGGMLGQAFNDLVVAWSGVGDRTGGEEARNLGGAAAMGGAGEGIGRVVGAAYPAAKAAVQAGASGFDRFLASMLGAKAAPEMVRRGAELQAKGVLVPPSAVYPESPYLSKAEDFYRVFHAQRQEQDPFRRSAEEYYNKTGRSILTEADPYTGESLMPGNWIDQQLTQATRQVPAIKEAGEASIKRATNEVRVADAAREVAKQRLVAARQVEGGGKEADRLAAVKTVSAAEVMARKAAQDAIDAGFADVRADSDAALKAVGADKHPGDLWETAGKKLEAMHDGIQRDFSKTYTSAHEAAGEDNVLVGKFRGPVREIYDSLPQEMRFAFPRLMDALDKVARPGRTTGLLDAAGNPIPARITLEQLHNARNEISSHINYLELHADRSQGMWRNLRSLINDVMHDPSQTASVQEGVRMIDATDKQYADFLKGYQQHMVDIVTKEMKTGYTQDADKLADLLFKPGQTTARENAQAKLGPDLWKAVQAADVQKMIGENTLEGVFDGAKFAKSFLDRVESGAYSKNAFTEKTQNLARNLLMKEGTIPIEPRQGDTIGTLLQRAGEYTKQVEVLAKENPLWAMSQEIKNIEQQYAKLGREDVQARSLDPLNFLSKSQLAIESATRILDSPDLSLAAASRFGADSPEATLLRQAGAWRLLQRSLPETTRLPQAMAEMDESVLRLWFPGVAKNELETLAKNMPFLLGGGADVGSSLAGASRVLNPATHLPGGRQRVLQFVPGIAFAQRQILAKYYSLLNDFATGQKNVFGVPLLQRVVRGLNGGPVERTEARAMIRRAAGWGGAGGAGSAEALYEMPPGGPTDRSGQVERQRREMRSVQ